MIGDKVHVRFMVGAKVETQTIEVHSSGGKLEVDLPMSESSMVAVLSMGQKRDIRERALFNPTYLVSITEEFRRR